jgi:hypothetical protein
MSDRFPSPCPEAIMHGPADRAGRCPWCGLRYDPPLGRPKLHHSVSSELTLAYDEFYDPDFGALAPAEIEHRYLMGLRS